MWFVSDFYRKIKDSVMDNMVSSNIDFKNTRKTIFIRNDAKVTKITINGKKITDSKEMERILKEMKPAEEAMNTVNKAMGKIGKALNKI